MSCRCAERRQVIALAARLVLAGRVEAIAPAARFVARTTAEDARAVFDASLAAARKRLGRAPN